MEDRNQAHDEEESSVPTDPRVASRLEFLDGLKKSVSTGRMGYTWERRFLYGGGAAFLSGAALGGVLGQRLANMRFLAENAHRMPTSKSGWFYYHRAKNRYRLYEGLKEGIVMGARVTPWVLLFFGVEEVIDISRVELGKNNTDALASTAAGLVVASMYSLTHRMPLPTATRMLKTGLFVGAGYGLAQDLFASFVGRPPQYVAAIKAAIHGSNPADTREPADKKA